MKTELAVVACLLAAACGGQRDDSVRYQLERTTTGPLPYLLRNDAGCSHMLYGGQVEFYGRGRYRSSFDIRKQCNSAPSEVVPFEGVDGLVRIARDTAFFTDSLGNSLGFGVLTADSLRVRGELHTLVYGRAAR